MHILDLTIYEIHEALLKHEVTIFDLVKESILRAKKSTNNAFEIICEEEAFQKAKILDQNEVPNDNFLYGIPYVAKNNISTKGIETNASSDILNGYVPLFNASVIQYLEDKNAILIGKTTLDELGMGGNGVSGHLGVAFNPFDNSKRRICGGSSCGSAVAVAEGIVPFSLGSDTGDSIRRPASFVGLVGTKPTRGAISRYGLFPFMQSMDTIGFFTRSVKDSEILLNELSKFDDKDLTSLNFPRPDYAKINYSKNIKKIAIINELYEDIEDETIKNKFDYLIEELKKYGVFADFLNFDKKLLKAIYPTYLSLSCAEASSNNANLDGIKFGQNVGGSSYEEMLFNNRTSGFSTLIKRRFVIGGYVLLENNKEDLYIKSKKCRRIIVDKVNSILQEYDAICCVSTPDIATYIDDAKDEIYTKNSHNTLDTWLALANFGGQPSITLPLGFKNEMPFGVSLISKINDEKNMFELSEIIEKITKLKGLSINRRN